MIFSSREEIGRAVKLLDEHKDGESVGESPVSETEDRVDVLFYQTRIQSIGTTDNKDYALMLLHFLTEPDTHRFCISKRFSEDITEDHKTVRIFPEFCDDILCIEFPNCLCLTWFMRF